MDKEQLHEAIQKLLFQDGNELSRQEYRELLEDISSECQDALNALDIDEAE